VLERTKGGHKSEFDILEDGLLYKGTSLCIPEGGDRIQWIREAHTSRVHGYFGITKTLLNLQRYVYWPKMLVDVTKFVRGCLMCATSKPFNRKRGLYLPLPVPKRPWDSVFMDFLEGLPTTKRGHDYLFVVVDRFSKMIILMPCTKTITATQAAKMFFEHVWKHFGLPDSIISDRDVRFCSHFWNSLWGMMDTRLKKFIAFQPQTDGHTEVMNHTLVHMLRGYNSKHPKTWDDSLPYLQFAFNRSVHSSSGKTPFETCYGYLPSSPFDMVFSTDSTMDGKEESDRLKAQKFLEKISAIHATVETQLKKSQAKYKEKSDKHRVPCNFSTADLVWLKISKDRLKGEGRKLKPLRYGPFRIIEQIGDNAFKLDLPPYLGVYSVINAEYLQLYEPPMLDDDGDEKIHFLHVEDL
jgi:hypothetical protein